MSEIDPQKPLHEIFERVVSRNRYGWRFDTDALRPDHGLRTVLERHRRNVEKWLRDVRELHCPKMGPVHFDYVENTAINAVAFEADGHEFVGVWVGAMASIYSFFGCMLANRNLLPDIGVVSAEIEFEPKVDDAEWLLRIPKDPARKAYAHLLSTIAVEFLFQHELGHLMNGHVRLLNKLKGINYVVEFEARPSQVLSNLDLQMLEMDADSFAVGQGMATVLGRLHEQGKVFPADWRQWYENPRHALFTWLFSVYSLFRLLYRGPVNLDDLEAAGHPPPGIRISMVGACIHEFLRVKGLDNLMKEFESILEEVIHTVETAHAVVARCPVDATGLAQSVDPRALRQINRVVDNWKIIRPQLE
jgi:hypothetical protein